MFSLFKKSSIIIFIISFLTAFSIFPSLVQAKTIAEMEKDKCNPIQAITNYQGYFSAIGVGSYNTWQADWGDIFNTNTTKCYLSDVQAKQDEMRAKKEEILTAYKKCTDTTQLKKEYENLLEDLDLIRKQMQAINDIKNPDPKAKIQAIKDSNCGYDKEKKVDCYVKSYDSDNGNCKDESFEKLKVAWIHFGQSIGFIGKGSDGIKAMDLSNLKKYAENRYKEKKAERAEKNPVADCLTKKSGIDKISCFANNVVIETKQALKRAGEFIESQKAYIKKNFGVETKNPINDITSIFTKGGEALQQTSQMMETADLHDYYANLYGKASEEERTRRLMEKVLKLNNIIKGTFQIQPGFKGNYEKKIDE